MFVRQQLTWVPEQCMPVAGAQQCHWMNTTKNVAKKNALKDAGSMSHSRPGGGVVGWGRILCKNEVMYFDPSHPILLPLNHVPFGASFPRGWVRRPGTQSQGGKLERRKRGQSTQLPRFVKLLKFPFNTGRAGPGRQTPELLPLCRGCPPAAGGQPWGQSACACAGAGGRCGSDDIPVSWEEPWACHIGRPGELRGWTGLSPWQVDAAWTPDFQLFLGDEGHCMVTCSRTRDRPPRLWGRHSEGPWPARATQPGSHPGPQLNWVEPGPQLELWRPCREGCVGQFKSRRRAPHGDLGLQRPWVRVLTLPVRGWGTSAPITARWCFGEGQVEWPKTGGSLGWGITQEGCSDSYSGWDWCCCFSAT